MFKNADGLRELYPRLLSHSTLCFGAIEVTNFLGRKLTGRFEGEVVSDLSSLACRRTGGSRIKPFEAHLGFAAKAVEKRQDPGWSWHAIDVTGCRGQRKSSPGPDGRLGKAWGVRDECTPQRSRSTKPWTR
jgi:hypothetical protein